MHPIAWKEIVPLDGKLPMTSAKIRKACKTLGQFGALVATTTTGKGNELLSADGVLRNSCVILEDQWGPVVCNLDLSETGSQTVTLCHLHSHPFAIFECKRVGIEEGMKKGPQTIEKAKQGAYVARSVSALQKVRLKNGSVLGVVERTDGSLYSKQYDDLLDEIVTGHDPGLLAGLILTVGVVSNHGNWFTSDNHNKELKVLAQSYDWLLFLTDDGLAQFVDKLLLSPTPELEPAKTAFLSSYTGNKTTTRFTKVRVDVAADKALRSYFTEHESEVEGWFNVISPKNAAISRLRTAIDHLRGKNWKDVLE
ncbi:MAG TPA: hypothetical protein VMV69_14170 [Pirellulales bacterium]|nr:hypothetical protein [Pirellulales bacterium]